MSVAALIVAAGRGTRAGGGLPKQYRDLGGATPLRLSVEAFLSLPEIASVTVVIHPDDRVLHDAALAGVDDPRLTDPTNGSDTRARSVRAGLEKLGARAPDKVLIHDAARPFVPQDVIRAVIAALDDVPGACAALPVVDALWSSDGDLAGASVPRDGLWRAQTPQGFRFEAILAAHRAHDGTGADDVAVARAAGLAVRFVPGSERSYKITTAEDLARARSDYAKT